jgi:hypothetical protein
MQVYTGPAPDPNKPQQEQDETQIMLEEVVEELPASIVEELPASIVMAMAFTKLCNQNMGYRGFPVEDETGTVTCEIRHQELHPAQEGALRLACQALGNYFIGLPADTGTVHVNGEGQG